MSLATYLRNVRTEMSHIVWPRPRTAIVHVALIALVSIITALIISGVDYAFSHALQRYLESH